MDESGCSSHATGKKKRVATGQRRFWSHKEEQALINALKSLRAQGWKCDGSFKGGYMVRLESIMAEQFPCAGILVKHIKSKLQVWKKAYSAIVGILGCSGSAGATMDPMTNMIITETEDVWEEYIKPQPFYNSWVEIFGNDRAQGTGALDVGDVVQELLYGCKSKEVDSTVVKVAGTTGTSPMYAGNEFDDDAVSNSPPTTASQQAKSSGSTKRKRYDPSMVDLDDIADRWMEKTTSAIGSLAEKLMQPPVPGSSVRDACSSARQALYKALKQIPGLSLNDIVLATRLLANNDADMDAFWGMDNEGRCRLVNLMLIGHRNG
ncbi:hypothetical protein CDL12_09030 [Handroanthus impetiginosus]|uniref:Myb/SANT-like domain-containing protein n=1 Tax=Handroanthus impetiginosus TaxID=429701 RepID=A0A2G9HLJ5_9LAMI|nr:hypothetical protein CDL12_09030 [Handroanthus impetiginosus]